MGKSKNKVTNWPEYNRALTQRGSITFWVDESAIEAWTCTKHHGKRGRRISEVSGDGAYDTKECHKILNKKKIKPLIPPRKSAGLWESGHPRNEAVIALKTGELKQWKADTGYHDRSLSETAMYRYKTLTSGTLSLRSYNAQFGEVYANVKAINKVIRLGMPERNTSI